MSFGTILEYRDPECPAGERVKLMVPILMKDGLNVRPEDLRVIVQFLTKSMGRKWKRRMRPNLLPGALRNPRIGRTVRKSWK